MAAGRLAAAWRALGPWQRRGAQAGGAAAGLAGLGLGTAALGLDDTALAEDLKALPRTFPRCAGLLYTWGTIARDYRRLSLRHDVAGDAEAAERSQELSRTHTKCARRLLRLCRANGGIYVKAGQLASMHTSVPPEYQDVLSALQDTAKPRRFRHVRRVIRRAFGEPVDRVFADFAREPAACASIAQVHRARLRDGTEVAVKVQHAGIATQIHADLLAFKLVARLAALLFPEKRTDESYGWLIPELEGTLEHELDFSREAANCKKVRLLTEHPQVTTPAVYEELSTDTVLTMEWVDGCKVTDREAIRGLGLAYREVVRVMTEMYNEMIFIHGFLHADAHPGNFLVRAKADGQGRPQPEVVLLDHGLYFQLAPEVQRNYSTLWMALVSGDRKGAAEVSKRVAGEAAAKVLPAVLHPQQLGQPALSPAHRRRLRREAGIGSPRALSTFLGTLPLDLIQAYRSQALTKNLASRAGWGNGSWLRATARYAQRGLMQAGEQAPSLLQRLRISFSIVRLELWLLCLEGFSACGYWVRGLAQ